MPHDRYYQCSPFVQGSVLSLSGQEFLHLTRVMRVKAGEKVELVNGQGELGLAEVIEIGKKQAELEVIDVTREQKPKYPLILAQAIPRMNRLDTIVEKITELGAAECWLFSGEGSEREEVTDSQRERLQTIAVSAMKQCGRLFLPEIKYFSNLSACPIHGYAAYFGDPEGNRLEKLEAKGTVAFIGPEKGFQEDEINWFKKQNIRGIKLHANILRTDTAAIFSIGLLHYLLADCITTQNFLKMK